MTEIANEPLRGTLDSPVGVHLGTVRELLSGPLRDRVTVPHRVDFHVLLFARRDSPAHAVDFEDHTLRRGEVLWVRPSQVHAFTGDADDYDVRLLSVLPDFLVPDIAGAARLDELGLPTVLRPGERDGRLLDSALDHLATELDHTAHLPQALATRAARHAASILMLHAGRLALDAVPLTGTKRDPLFLRFRREVEEHFTITRDAADYARRVGYSRRTLDRAVRSATGESAKKLIDRRVVLEAKRLLTHTELTVGRIGQRLGFEDTANFARFFKQYTGVTPLAFRDGRNVTQTSRSLANVDRAG